ncbi:universal stress protein [Spongiivirga sp. MCCC 1A20706]|uniref:universal stress protein n=1 Tax=Spongiivirga sp. MCCC 1A20706 TaxID=3160963 RepID=UPI003977550C
MKRILIPTDFSETAQHAIDYAITLFKNEDCTFYLLNVFSVDNYSTSNLGVPEPGNPAYEAKLNAAQKELKKIADLLDTKTNDNHHFEIIASYNVILHEIEHLVEKRNIDLVVMGTKGVTDNWDKIFGSNAANIMDRLISCPVIAVPKTASLENPKEIVFPTSFKLPYNRQEIVPMLNIARKANATLRILHVIEENELSDLQKKNKALLEEDLTVLSYTYHELTNLDVDAAIHCFAESRDADMIALIHHKHGFFDRLLKKSVTKKIGNAAKVPMLAMHLFN